MTGIAIYVEGGGDSTDGKTAIRRGIDGFLAAIKEQARAKRWHWKVVACGGRDQAKNAFLHARSSQPGVHTYLLVDSEGPVVGQPVAYLHQRDNWNLAGVPDEVVHLMVQVMETWLVAHPQALAAYYGQGFLANALPAAQNLETVAKPTVANALAHATQPTQKGEYHNIHHAEDLLKRVDPATVRTRCPHCDRFWQSLTNLIQGA